MIEGDKNTKEKSCLSVVKAILAEWIACNTDLQIEYRECDNARNPKITYRLSYDCSVVSDDFVAPEVKVPSRDFFLGLIKPGLDHRHDAIALKLELDGMNSKERCMDTTHKKCVNHSVIVTAVLLLSDDAGRCPIGDKLAVERAVIDFTTWLPSTYDTTIFNTPITASSLNNARLAEYNQIIEKNLMKLYANKAANVIMRPNDGDLGQHLLKEWKARGMTCTLESHPTSDAMILRLEWAMQ